MLYLLLTIFITFLIWSIYIVFIQSDYWLIYSLIHSFLILLIIRIILIDHELNLSVYQWMNLLNYSMVFVMIYTFYIIFINTLKMNSLSSNPLKLDLLVALLYLDVLIDYASSFLILNYVVNLNNVEEFILFLLILFNLLFWTLLHKKVFIRNKFNRLHILDSKYQLLKYIYLVHIFMGQDMLKFPQ